MRASENPPWFVPADYESRTLSEEVTDMSEIRTGGPGWATTRACFDCGNSDGNLQIWYSWWCSRNGDATANDVIRCAQCKRYSLYITGFLIRACLEPTWPRSTREYVDAIWCRICAKRGRRRHGRPRSDMADGSLVCSDEAAR